MKEQARIITAHSCAASLKACDPDDFSNPYILLKIAATLPVTSCECERLVSTKRRLNNYTRCTMGEARLSSLAIMYIKYKQSRAGELGGGRLKLLLRDTLQHTWNFVKRFLYLAGMYHYV